MNKICLITCYMGPLPDYFHHFERSCHTNPDVDFIVVGDHVGGSAKRNNLQLVQMSFDELNKLASQKTGTSIRLSDAWKINELKPLFGHIFDDYVRNHSHWGWCDLDIIWGRIRHFLNDEVLDNCDVLATRKHWTTGHFTLFRNNDLNRTLYLRHGDVFGMLNDSRYYSFEECCHRWHGEISSPAELRAQGLCPSMWDIVNTAAAAGELRACFTEIIREYPQPVNHLYSKGVLTDLGNGQEFMYFHLLTIKKSWRFFTPVYKKNWQVLKITPFGIRAEGDPSLWWFARRVISCLKGIRKSAAKQSWPVLLKKLFRFRKPS